MNHIQIMFYVLILLVSVFESNAYSGDTILTFRLVHPDHDTISFQPPSEVDVDKRRYEHFEKGREHYWVNKKVELDITDMKEAVLRVITPPSKKEIEELSKVRPNTSVSLEPVYNLAVSLNAEGREKLRKLTKDNISRRLAIIFEGRMLVAPVIMEEITGGEVVVSGIQCYDEAVRLRDAINNR